jgi:cell shape-determining protein MreC
MKVLIDNKLTYDSGKLNVKVGDKVVLPGLPWMKSETYVGTVTSLETDYSGPCKQILEIAQEDSVDMTK